MQSWFAALSTAVATAARRWRLKRSSSGTEGWFAGFAGVFSATATPPMTRHSPCSSSWPARPGSFGATGRWRRGFTVSVFGVRVASGPYRNRSHWAYHAGSIRAIGPSLAEPSRPR